MGEQRGADAVTTSPTSTVRRIAMHQYQFRSSWVFDRRFEDVSVVLSRLDKYAEWWPQVTRSERNGDMGRAQIDLRSALPFTLRLQLERDVEDVKGGYLRAIVHGDLDGFVSWTVDSCADGTRAAFDQVVTLEHTIVKRVDVMLRPVLQWNHSVAMHGCAIGLRRRLLDGQKA